MKDMVEASERFYKYRNTQLLHFTGCRAGDDALNLFHD